MNPLGEVACQYHLRERVGNGALEVGPDETMTHPLTQVVLTGLALPRIVDALARPINY
jgi:hypothetical protein